jgi:phage FluMu gp28-like protein
VALPKPPPSVSIPSRATRAAERDLIDLFTRCQTDKALFAKAFFDLDVTPFQQEVMDGHGRVDTVVAGRRTGKTTAVCIDRVHDLATAGYNRVGIVGAPSLDQAQQYIREIQAAAERSPNMAALIEGGPDRGIHRRTGFPTVDFVTGGSIQCRATVEEGRYMRGRGADWVVLTEAAFIGDIVLDRAVRPLVLDRHGTIHLESTPNGPNYVQRFFERATEVAGRYTKASENGYYTSAHGTVFDNPRLSREDIEAIRTEVPEWVFETEYLAVFKELGDAVFSWPLLVKLFDHDYGQIAQASRATRRYAIGVDLAQVSDFTAICVLDITESPYKLAHWRRFRGVSYVGSGGVVEQVNELQRAFNGARVFVDATSEKAVAESINNAQPVVFTVAERTAMLSHLIVLCENQGLQLSARWPQLRDEMRQMRRMRMGNSVRADHPRDGYDDCVWSLALACRAVTGKRASKPIPPEVAEAFRVARWFPADAQ